MAKCAQSWDRLTRRTHALLCRIIPSWRERRRLEMMVGPVGVWKALQRFQLDCLKSLGLLPHHHLLDIGCGPLQGGLVFIRYLEPAHYVGVDIREHSVVEGRRQVAKAGLGSKRPLVLVSSTFGKEELGDRTFDYLWISQLLYHLDDELVEACFTEVVARMRPEGRLIGDFIATDGPPIRSKDHWQGFTFFERPFEYFADVAVRHGLQMIRRGKLRDFGYPVKWTYNLSNNELLEFRKNQTRAASSLVQCARGKS